MGSAKADNSSYSSYAELSTFEQIDRDYRIVAVQRPSPIAVIAPHGGGIEPGTSEIAAALAGERYSLYDFQGLKTDGNEKLHITSSHFDEPQALALVQASRFILAIHGCATDDVVVYLGGSVPKLQAQARHTFAGLGIRALKHPVHYAGEHPLNICNRSQTGRSLQLELSAGLRRRLFASLDRPGRQQPTPLFHQIIVALQPILHTIEVTL